jgi:hypothetical protein
MDSVAYCPVCAKSNVRNLLLVAALKFAKTVKGGICELLTEFVGGDRDGRVSRLLNGTQGRRAQELTMIESV